MIADILNIHPDVLDNSRQELLSKLIPLTTGFVLREGTALALQLAHRKSFDFDFFSPSPIAKNLLNKLNEDIPSEKIMVDSPDELPFFTKDGIKLTLLYYPFIPHYPNIKLEDS